MTHDILLTDIELAKALLSDHRSDDEVVTALSRRGVAPAQAERLLDDLHNGRPVQPQMTAPEMQKARDSMARRSAPRGDPARSSPEPQGRSHRRSSSSAKGSRRSSRTAWWVFAFLACLAIAAACLIYRLDRQRHAQTSEPRAVAGDKK